MATSDSPVDLRPLTTSQLIDRGFTLYRQNFAGLFLLALLCQIAPLATSQVMLAATKLVPGGAVGFPMADPVHGLIATGVWAVGQLITFCFEVVMTFYLAEAYLGREPTIKAGFRRLGMCWGGALGTSVVNMVLLGVTLLFPLVAVGAIYFGQFMLHPQSFLGILAFLAGELILLVASVAPVLIVFMRLMLTVPAVALESLVGWRAVKRSAALVRYDPGLGFLYWGEMRLSLLLLPLFVIELLALSLTSAPLLIHEINEALRHGSVGQIVAPPESAVILSQILVVLSGSLLMPLYLIATTLFYYDVRIRREGFDLEFMAGQA